jgi:transcriptional regulator with PAS, ATPase and Fis domain
MSVKSDDVQMELTDVVQVDVSAERLERYRLDNVIGASRPMQQVFAQVHLVAPTKSTIVLRGESGTGKELVARTLHELSPRAAGPFVAINCAAIPDSLLESEIFGHERGAFTGAEARRQGCFELANHGTLFLDEVAEMAPATQVKLLRVLEERAFRRLGGQEEIQVDVRVVAATNRDPEAALRDKRLREDLFYRLNVFTLELAPLRQRIEDVPLLAEQFVGELSKANRKTVTGLGPSALDALRAHDWPGNVRELRNVIERAVILARRPVIALDELPANLRQAPAASMDSTRRESRGRLPVGTTVDEAERDLILRTLEATDQNKTRAAQLLGISLKTLHNKLKKYRSSP